MKGFLIMGKFLSVDLMAKLAEQSRVNFSISQDPARTQSILGNTQQTHEEDRPFLIEYAGDDSLNIYSVFHDIAKKPAFIVRSTMDRDIIR
jgi:sensor domain CHASE-containing protein